MRGCAFLGGDGGGVVGDRAALATPAVERALHQLQRRRG